MIGLLVGLIVFFSGLAIIGISVSCVVQMALSFAEQKLGERTLERSLAKATLYQKPVYFSDVSHTPAIEVQSDQQQYLRLPWSTDSNP